MDTSKVKYPAKYRRRQMAIASEIKRAHRISLRQALAEAERDPILSMMRSGL